jgi:hypothetical protein
VNKDASAALALAQRNFSTQRDYEDVALLRRAALAANASAVVSSVERWSRTQGIATGAAP